MVNAANGVAGTEMVDVELETRNGNAGNVKNGHVVTIAYPTEPDDHDSIAEEVQRKKRDLPPLRYCVFITENPKLAFGLTLGGLVVMILTTGLLLLVGYDILPITFDRMPLDIRNDVDYLRYAAWNNRFEDENNIIRRRVSSNGTELTRTEKGDVVELFFEKEEGNVFTKENLMAMKKVEDEFWLNEEFQKSFCLRGQREPHDCVKPESVLRFFDGTYASIDPIFNDTDFDEIIRVLNTARLNNDTRAALYYTLGKESTIDATKAHSTIIRERFYLGVPLEGYKNISDRDEDQFSDIQTFSVDNFKSIGKKYFSDGVGDMEFFYGSMSLLFDFIMSMVMLDMALVVGSLFFIMLFLLIQTGSFWVSGWAIFSILSGFLCTNLIYRIVLDFRYFGIFHVLAIFILLCIGADDVFVFFDTWKYSGQHQYQTLAHRLSDCYRKAAGAMFFTSLTTAVAFAVSAASPMLGISSFGLFSALLIVVNYISIIVFFPTVVVTYHLFWEKYKCCCCCPRDACSVADIKDTTPAADARSKKSKKLNPIVRFFGGPYFRLITHPVARWVILTCFAGIVATSLYFVSRIEINEEQIKFVKESTNFGRYIVRSSSAFEPREDAGTTKIMLVWGLKLQDLGRCHRTDHTCMGDTVFDDTFNLDSTQAQQALLDLCQKIKTMPKEDRERLRIREDLVSGESEVECFIEEMNSFYRDEPDRGSYPNGTSLLLPNGEQGRLIMDNNPDMYNRSRLPNDFDRYFAVSASYWLYNGFRGPMITEQLIDYSDILGEIAVPGETQEVERPPSGERDAWTYKYGTRLKFAAIAISTDMESENLGFSKGLKIRDAWEDFITNEKKNMPDSLGGGFQTTAAEGGEDSLWHWLKLQKKLVSAAMQGILIGLGVALPILVFATSNIITGLLATCSIILSTLCVIAVIPLGGWKLGLMESINLTLVVGLSVDYVVHLAEGYSRSTHTNRLGRLHDSLAEVGISVLSGACTTLGGSAFLLLAQIILFMQFGVFMFATILFSLVFALGLFTTVLGIVGPENDRGSIKPIKRWLWKLVTCKFCKK